MADAAIEIKVEDDAVKPVEVVLDDKAPKDGAAKVVTAEEGIDDLKAQVEKARRESAERRAAGDREIQVALQRASAAEARETVAKRDHVGTIMEKLAADKDAAKRDLKLAHEAGDFDKVADAQDRISMANARIVEAEKGKLALEDEIRTPQRQPQAQPNDPVEAYARTMSPRAAAWIRQHPQVIVRGSQGYEVAPRAMSAHYAAIDEGVALDSDEYFERLDSALGAQRRAEPRQERQQQNNGRDVSRSPTSAPVNRDSVQAPGAPQRGTVKLEAHEVQNAIDTLGPLYPDKNRNELCKIWVENRNALIAEGRMGGREGR